MHELGKFVIWLAGSIGGIGGGIRGYEIELEHRLKEFRSQNKLVEPALITSF